LKRATRQRRARAPERARRFGLALNHLTLNRLTLNRLTLNRLTS
jgi:hypothetical protein